MCECCKCLIESLRDASVAITESLHASKHTPQEEKFDKFPDIGGYYFYSHDTNELDKSSLGLQYGVSCHHSSNVPSNGKIQSLCCHVVVFVMCLH